MGLVHTSYVVLMHSQARLVWIFTIKFMKYIVTSMTKQIVNGFLDPLFSMASWFGVDVAFNPPMSCSGLCGPPSSHLVQIGNHPHSGCFWFCLIVLISFSKTIEMRFCIYNLTSNSQIENKWIKTWTEGRLHSMNINHHTPMGLSDDLSIAFIGK